MLKQSRRHRWIAVFLTLLLIMAVPFSSAAVEEKTGGSAVETEEKTSEETGDVTAVPTEGFCTRTERCVQKEGHEGECMVQEPDVSCPDCGQVQTEKRLMQMQIIFPFR